MSGYSDHITEVFINPIRSVLAIDDRFPTLDRLVAPEPNFVRDDNSDRLFKLLEYCRSANPQWLVDVHDGQGIGNTATPVAKLRQCNWLILDYKLDGDAGDGSRAISALRSLAVSDHFNLVVIYTADKAEMVLHHAVTALSSLSKMASMTPDHRSEVDRGLIIWEDSDPRIREKLSKEISHAACVTMLRNKKIASRLPQNRSALHEFNRLVELLSKEHRIDPDKVLRYFVSAAGDTLSPADSPTFDVEFSAGDAKSHWLVAGNIFVSIEEKTTEPAQLLASLKAALEEWHPSPNQLVIAKLRADHEAFGLQLDRAVVSDKNLQAFWLKLLLDSDPREEAHHIGILIDRQSELLADRLRTSVIDFTTRLITDLRGEASSDVLTERYFGVSSTDQAAHNSGLIAHNIHVSTKPWAGKNLTNGHILKFVESVDSSCWICLSPACDLEAGRETGRDLKTRIKPWAPVTILKLHKMGEKRALELATRGWVLFIVHQGKREQFSYFPNADPNLNPVWEEVFAKNEGRFSTDGKVVLARIRPGDGPNLLPGFLEADALVTAQLRSEYAANLTLRFTAHLSRIGLDYHSKTV